MNTYFQEPTPEYIEYIKEYNRFLKLYVEAQECFIKKYKPNGDNTEYFLQYEQAIKTHIQAKDAYIRLVSKYEELVLRHSDNILKLPVI